MFQCSKLCCNELINRWNCYCNNTEYDEFMPNPEFKPPHLLKSIVEKK